MAVGAVQLAKRGLVAVLLALALVYHVTLSISRDSSDDDVTKAYRRVLLKSHPDKGGKTEDQQRLQGAKDEWDDAKKDAASRGRPGDPGGDPGRRASDPRAHTPTEWVELELADPNEAKKRYRIQSAAVLLTFNGGQYDWWGDQKHVSCRRFPTQHKQKTTTSAPATKPTTSNSTSNQAAVGTTQLTYIVSTKSKSCRPPTKRTTDLSTDRSIGIGRLID
jgi:curved DNA-binding protein CbpA